MTTNRCSVSVKLCLLLLVMWAYRDAEGRPHEEQVVATAVVGGGYWKPEVSVTINTGPAAGGVVNIVVYPGGGRWIYGRDDEIPLSTTSKPTYQQGTTPGKTTHVTANHHHAKTTTQSPSSTTIGNKPYQVIVAPPIPRECPEGEKPDMANNCREEWPDFSRRVAGKSEYVPSRSTAAPTTTAKTSSAVHHTRKHRL